jgi:hypothetical protein
MVAGWLTVQPRGARHGLGSFSWTVAERWLAAGLSVDTISTDLWSGNTAGWPSRGRSIPSHAPPPHVYFVTTTVDNH